MKIGYTTIHDIRTAPVNRFDGSFHLSDGIQVRQIIANLPFPTKKCGEVASRIFHAGRWKRVYVDNPEHGITLLGSSTMLKSNLQDEKLVSIKYTEDIADKTLESGWILISCSGTIGKTAFTNAGHAGKLASQHVIRLKPNDILGAGYIYAYLSSKYGYTMLTQGTFGAVIQHIEPDNVATIPIPLFAKDFQKKIDGMIQESSRLREEAAEQLKRAIRILNNAFGIVITETKFTTAKASIQHIFNSLQNRLDPPAIMNSGVKAMEQVRINCEWIPLGETGANVRRPGIFKRIYVEEGLPYIKGSEIFNINPFMRCEHLSLTRTPFIDEMRLYEGQILLTCAGSIGEVKMITKEYEDNKAIGSQDIIRIETKDKLFTKEYLFAYLQLPFVFQFIQSMKYGSVIERVEPFHIESIPVIKPTKELSQIITTIITKYMEDMYNAFTLEDGAIKMVEAEIEKWSKK